MLPTKGGADGIWWSPRTSNPFVGRLRRPRWVRFPHVPAIAGREGPPMNLFPTWIGHPAVIAVIVLLVALAQGLHYLLGHSSLGPEFNRGVVIGVYVFGGILFLFLAIAHFFT